MLATVVPGVALFMSSEKLTGDGETENETGAGAATVN
jgi:hypothetical protein